MSAQPEPIRPPTAGLPGRSASEIRRDIDQQRRQLGKSVELFEAAVLGGAEFGHS